MKRAGTIGVAALGVLFVLGLGFLATEASADCVPVPAPWGFAIACWLDRGGTATETFTCSADTVKADTDDGKYQILGQCTHWTEAAGDTVFFFKAAGTYFYNAPYKRGETKESVAVFRDANRTEELGALNGQFDCPKNPFVNARVACKTQVFNNTTGANVLNSHVPLTGGLAAGAEDVGQASGALTAAKNESYIGVWRSGSDSDHLWQADRWDIFTAVWKELARRDLRLVDLETFASGGKRYYSGVWRSGSDGYYLWRADGWKAFTDKWEELAKQNLRLVDVETFAAGGKRHYVGVWRAGTDGHYLWQADAWKAFTDKWEELAKQNLRLVDLETFVADGKRHYIGVWRSGTDGHYLWRAEGWKAFTAKWEELAKQNLRLVRLETYSSGDKQHYIGIWRAGTDGHYLWRAKSWAELAAKRNDLGKQNLRLVDVAKP